MFSADGTRSATYNATKSSGNDVVFDYTVLATDDDDSGIWVACPDQCWDLLATGAIKDSFRTAADRKDADLSTWSQRQAHDSHRIDSSPRIVSVEITSDPDKGGNSDTYGLGDVIEITVTFNQDLTVAGDPELQFSVDGARRATYDSSRSSAKTVVFTYTVVATDDDDNGIYIG